MSSKTLIKSDEVLPSVFDDFFKPWNEWFNTGGLWGRTMNVPAVNIAESKSDYKVSVAAPGFKKSDFNIRTEGNMLTISSQKEESKEEKGRYTRKEYSYSSFSRSFTVPEEVNQDKIDAIYEDGVLTVTLPKKEDAKKLSVSKQVTVQ